MITSDKSQPVEFLESTQKKLISVVINFFLLFGLLWIPLPGSMQLPSAFESIDLYLTLLLTIPFGAQLFSLKRKTSLKIDASGITENISSNISRHYPWNNIQSFKFIKLLNSKYLIINAKNEPIQFEQLSMYAKFIAKLDKKRFGSPFHISLSKIPYSVDEIFNELKKIAENRHM